MTDDELKALVASIALDQKKTDEQMSRTDEKIDRLADQITRTEEQMKRTDEKLERMSIRTEERMKRTDEQMKRTDEKLERLGIHLGGITQNQGDVAEEFFLNSLANDTRLGSIHFDDIAKNMNKRKGQLQEEYDIVMTNGNAIAVVEVKYKARVNDLQKLERKLRHFKQLFPLYQTHKLYGALAAFHINDDVKCEALERGYFVLQRCGDVIHTENNEQLAVF